MTVRQAKTEKDIREILILQGQNLRNEQQSLQSYRDGFVTVKHEFELLDKMNKAQGHIIAVENDEVVGYVLAMPATFREQIAILQPMFEIFDRIHYRNRNLNEYNYYVIGQACIAPDFRGTGLLGKMYDQHRECYSKQFDFCITEVSTSNARSIRAHEKQGFKTIYSYSDQTDEWHIILWNWIS